MSGLDVQGIAHAFNRHPVLDGVSLGVERGQLACLLGPSGCGKTSLLRLAAGLERLQQGRILIDGRIVSDTDGTHVPPERRGVGLMFQDYALFPHLTVSENICFGLPGPSAGGGFPVAAAMARVGLTAHANAYPHTLSGGQQQRVALLRALAPAPRILLLDEPFSDLDVNRRVQVRESTFSLLKEAGAATLMVTHDPEEAMYMADRIFVMKAGRIVQAGTPSDIYFRPSDPFVAGLFGPVNRLSGTAVGQHVTTPIGRLAAPGLTDGCPVDILVRMEGLEIPVDGRPSVAARIASARLLGRSTHLDLRVPTGDGDDISLQCRTPGVPLLRPGDTVRIAVDRAHCFVFPAAGSGESTAIFAGRRPDPEE